MSKKDDGGAAFPRQSGTIEMGGATGMSLRDWFAGQYIAGRRYPIEDWYEEARAAYEFADAMLKERAK